MINMDICTRSLAISHWFDFEFEHNFHIFTSFGNAKGQLISE